MFFSLLFLPVQCPSKVFLLATGRKLLFAAFFGNRSYKTTSRSGQHFLVPQQFSVASIGGAAGEKIEGRTRTQGVITLRCCVAIVKAASQPPSESNIECSRRPTGSQPPPPRPTAHMNALIVPLPLALALFKTLQSLSLTDVSYGML